MRNISIYVLSGALILLFACRKDPVEVPAVYDPSPYLIALRNFPDPGIPADNTPTNAGVQLGRMLFYEKSLSRDGSMSCADCHRQQHGFSDTLKYSIGVEKLPGKRHSMALINLAWHKDGLFWDGRSPHARNQALKPIQDPLEMNESLENVVSKLQGKKIYRDQFIRAFGSDTITAEKIGLAIEQFEFALVSNNSKFDQWKRGETALTDSEERGRQLFFTEFDPSGVKKGAECFHCHSTFNFTNNEYMNNGLDAEADQSDPGRMNVTGNPADKAMFKVPTLRNVAISAPFMHDGRFSTLEQVIEHYNTGVRNSSTVDFLMQYNLQPGGLGLNAQDKADLIAFLKTLTDQEFISNPLFKSPF